MGNARPTAKFVEKFTNTQMDMAAGLGPWEKSSEVIIQGIDPGPIAKNKTDTNTLITLIYFIQSYKNYIVLE